MASARGYGDLKAAVGDAVVAELAPLQERYREIRADVPALEAVLAAGADKARAIAASDAGRRARGDGSRTASARTPGRTCMPDLVLGPLLRYVSDTEATVWVETDAPCEVTVLDRSARTFTVAGHHYALVVIDGLEPGSTLPYEVALDGVARWPRPTTRIRRASSAPTRTTSSCASRSAPAASRCRTPSPTS